MSKKATISIIISIVLILIIISIHFIPGLISTGLINTPMSSYVVKYDYYIYKEPFNTIAHYISDNDVKRFDITKEKFAQNSYSILGSDVNNAITELIKANYTVIGIQENTLYFKNTASIEYDKGILYSLDGKLPYIDHMTGYKRLSEENWYYYEANNTAQSYDIQEASDNDD